MQIETEKTPKSTKRRVLPIAMNPNLDKFYEAPDKEAFLKEELGKIADALERLPIPESYAEVREQVLEANAELLDSFSDIYGIDAWPLGRTRMQKLGGVMGMPTAFMQIMVGSENSSLQGTGDKSFFTSRFVSPDGRVQLNATSIVLINDLPYAFSVLKRIGKDDFGEFGADFPALGAAREVLIALREWHEFNSPGTPLEEDELINDMVYHFNERVHDILHALFLYDTKALTKAFQKFSRDIYFARHLFKDPNKINYEFIVDRAFYDSWQNHYEDYPEDKELLLESTEKMLERLNDFEEFLKIKRTPEEAKRIAEYVGFVGIRGVVHKIRYDGPELKALAKKHPVLKDILALIPDNHKEYLDGIYSEEFGKRIPWGESDEGLTFNQVFEKYIQTLEGEFKAGIDIDSKNSTWKNSEKAIEIIKKTPHLRAAIGEMQPHKFSPDVIIQYGKLIQNIENQFGPRVAEALAARVEIDEDDGFYFRLDRKDINFAEGVPGVLMHSKRAILVQIPYDYHKDEVEIKIMRPKTLLQNETGAVAHAKPGDFILLNVQDPSLAMKILSGSYTGDGFDFDKFQTTVTHEIESGTASMGAGDIYPYPKENAVEIFGLEQKGVVSRHKGKLTLKPGFYQTSDNPRFAYKIAGPVSMDSETGERRRVHQGVIVRNHIQKGIPLDFFPVDRWSIRRNYKGKADSLPEVEVTDEFARRLGLSGEMASRLVNLMVKRLEYINTIKVYGPRGEAKKVVFEDIL